ncbi:MAG: glycosyltransferase family 4 protein [Fimbriimonadaceae bacterium]
MKILNHDYAGHAFQIELSRALARRGHEVLHVYNASDTTPKGPLSPRADDPLTLSITGLTLADTVAKGSLVKRWRQERTYGQLAANLIRRERPDIVLSGNTPLDAQAAMQRATLEQNAHFVYWLQDFVGIATNQILRRKLPLIGSAIGSHYAKLEVRLLTASHGVIAISDDFVGPLEAMRVAKNRLRVIENWAPLDDVSPQPKVNPWSESHCLDKGFAFVYSGAMGMKHNPELLVRLAKTFADDVDVRIVVISEGIGAEWLKVQREAQRLENLILLPFQPYADLSLTLGAADVLVALLEPSAGTYSVPSKILSYHCAGRALLVAVPSENLASRTVLDAASGLAVAPTDFDGWTTAAKRLREDARLRARCAESARAMAERNFSIEPIADKFETFLIQVWGM